MSHLRLVPPLTDDGTDGSVDSSPWDDPKVARVFFQAASGLCLCRECTKKRHPAFGAL